MHFQQSSWPLVAQRLGILTEGAKVLTPFGQVVEVQMVILDFFNPTDDDEMVWTRILAQFERTFVWAGDRAVALGSGVIWCSVD